MTKREKITLLIALTLLIAVLFLIDNSSNNKRLIKDSNEIIKELHKKNKVYTNRIATLQDSIIKLQKKDTVIITKYKQKIDSVYAYNYNDYVVFYDTLLNTNLANVDTFICFDSISIQKLSIKLLECGKDSELLANCYIQNNLYANIINIQDSVISLKDSINASLEDMYKQKVKKVKRQRNVATGVALVEFLVILGLISN
jgi:hypothetical protein